MIATLGLILSSAVSVTLAEDESEWIGRGRILLDAGRGVEAEELFESVSKLEPSALTPRVWIIRSWLAQGRINDALDATDALVAEGLDGPPVDYLYGMSWFAAAESKRLQGDNQESLRRNMLDCITHLKSATAERPSRYRDAFRPLAKTAWLSQRLDLASQAVDSAATYYPNDSRIWHLKGRVAHERFTVEQAIPGNGAAAAALFDRSEQSYRHTIGLIGAPAEQTALGAARAEVLLAETWLQLGFLLATRTEAEAQPAAIEALSNAVAWRPERVDYRELSSITPPDVFMDAVEIGLAKFEKRLGREPRTGGAYWWLGYSAFRMGLFDRAERSFVAAISSKAKDIESAWYYLGRLRFLRQDFSGAVSALRSSWERDPAALFQALDVDKQFNITMIDNLASWCVRQRRAVDATIFYELSAEFAQSATAWQKLGEFLTAEGNRLFKEQGAGNELAERSHLTALAAFNRALEIEPTTPIHLFNTARHLHRTLGMNLTEARSLYKRAHLEAGRRLIDQTTSIEKSSELRALRSEALRSLKELAQSRGE